ncbi:MAG: ATP-binding cassette domain-containing protein [Proteobacteria bacterium]|nr:ATP-binding cassette domain-containing protein [Pseudomonadota bacterium]
MFLLRKIVNDNIALFKSVYKVYGPTFEFKKENRWQWFLLASIILLNIAQAVLLVVTNTFLTSIFGILTPGITLGIFAKAAFQYMFAVGAVAVSSVANVFVNGKLIQFLDEHLSQEYVKKWLNTNAFIGLNYIPPEKQKLLNTAVFFSHDIQKSNALAVKSFDNLVSTFLQFLAGLYGLWQLSSPLTVTLLSTAITIPAIFPVGAITYAFLYCLIISRIDFKMRDTTRHKKETMNQLAAHSNHVDRNAEGIALLRGNQRENDNFLSIIKRAGNYQAILNRLQSALSWFTIFNEHLQSLAVIVLSIPQLITKQLNQGNIFSISNYFGKVVKFFTWQGEHCEDISNLTVLGDKFQLMSEQTATWDAIQKQSNLKITKKDRLILNELLIKKPNNKDPFLKIKDFEFNHAKVTLLQGPSGVGKSSLFRALARLWPYVEGSVTLPNDERETYFMPQRVFFPNMASLYDAITYPHHCGKRNIVKIKSLMEKFELSHLIANAELSKDWSKTLSGGEQQKIALIRAICHKPKLLFMDEPFASMDAKSKEVSEKNLLSLLPNTTIICIDHQGDSQFYDYLVTFNNQRLTQKPLKALSEKKTNHVDQKIRRSV